MLFQFLSTIVSISSFLVGFLLGIVVCVFTLINLLKSKPSDDTVDSSTVPYSISSHNIKEKSYHSITNPAQVIISNANIASLKNLINYLDEFNSPLKNFGNYLEQVYVRRDANIKEAEQQSLVVMELNEFTKMEKEFYDAVSSIKEQCKQTKLMSSFLTDISKAFSSFGKDLNKLSGTARNNMHRGGMLIDTKEEMIANNWWQALHVSLECLSSDQEYLSNHITDDLLNYSSQMYEELNVIDKRLLAEGTKQILNMKEQLNSYEAKKRERAKYLEKINNTPPSTLTTQSQEAVLAKRRLKQKINDESVIHQKKILLSTQKEFHIMMARIHADIQLTVLKTIVDQHSQLSKVCEAFDRTQGSYETILKRMRIQLTNAASSLVQMIREEGEFAEKLEYLVNKSTVAGEKPPYIMSYEENLRMKMTEIGLQGFELNLQHVLSDLLKLCTNTQYQLEMQSKLSPKLSNDIIDHHGTKEASKSNGSSTGKLNMFQESTSCLAASNPAILPLLPQVFMNAIGMETCVWFNSFSGRVYRDISHSKWFYHWFCRKLSTMLNKGPRPDYIDEFKVSDVKFGLLPPLLLNMQWSPYLNTTDNANNHHTTGNKDGNKLNKDMNKDSKSDGNPPESDDSDLSDQEENKLKKNKSKIKIETDKEKQQHQQRPDDAEYYAACNADMAFRSGIEFTISTKLWINWPRDRYASVPVTLHLNLAECSGPIRFGVTKSYSFFSFIGDPAMRISVRNEIGKGVFHIKDMPQISDFIVKKLKSFIHRKIVYPNSHKFRLIWPRNWWPEGTQDLFTESTPGMNSSVPMREISKDGTAVSIKVDPNVIDQSAGDNIENRKIRSKSDSSSTFIDGKHSHDIEQQNIAATKDSLLPSNTTGSSYETMKHKLTNWLQKTKERRNSKSINNSTIAIEARNHPTVVVAGDDIDERTKSTENTPLKSNRIVSRDRRNHLRSTSDKMQLLLNSARQSRTLQRITSKFVHSSEAMEFERQENETTELALQSLTKTQQEVLRDNVAWDFAVKSLSMKYIEQYNTLPQKHSIASKEVATISSPTSHNNDNQAHTLQKQLVRIHSIDTHTQQSAVRALNADYPTKYHLRTTSQSPEQLKLTKMKSARMIYTPDFTDRKIFSRHSFNVDYNDDIESIGVMNHNQKPIDQQYDISIPRVHSLSDFRSSVVDAMFVLHIINSHYDIEEIDNSNNHHLDQYNDSPAEVEVHQREAFSLSNPTDIDAYRSENISAEEVTWDEEYADKMIPPVGRIAGSIATPNKWNTNITIAKNKFADFKAKHLNNREFSQVFKRNHYSNNSMNTSEATTATTTRERRNSSTGEDQRSYHISGPGVNNNNPTIGITTSAVMSPKSEHSKSTLQTNVPVSRPNENSQTIRTSPGHATTAAQQPQQHITATSAAMKYVSSIFRSSGQNSNNSPNNK